MRRTSSGALAAQTGRCGGLLGAYAALDRSRSFLLAAGAEALPPAPIVADAPEAPAGLRYVPEADAFTLVGPPGARIPAALNPGAVAREAARRQLRTVARAHPDEAEGVALFLGAAAAVDPGYLGASVALSGFAPVPAATPAA